MRSRASRLFEDQQHNLFCKKHETLQFKLDVYIHISFVKPYCFYIYISIKTSYVLLTTYKSSSRNKCLFVRMYE